MTELVWALVVVAAVALLVAFVARSRAGRRRPRFATRPLPVGYFNAYQSRLTELQALFVDEPRDAVAGARHLVDDLLVRLGYPTRLDDNERRADLSSVDRRHGEWYRLGTSLRPDSSTEELRRALRAYCELARSLMERAQPDRSEVRPGREIAS